MREAADGWREVAAIDDDAVARMVREDRIDILIDLAGHSKGNRLGVFARRVAPVQLTWLGYPDTTGLAAIDSRITDHTADPAPAAELRHSERLLRIESGFLSYLPPADAPPVKPRAPGAAVVFSSFNSLAKVNAQSLRLWGRILAGVPGSRLVLKSSVLGFPDTVDRLLDAFERAGIDPAQVDLQGWISGRQQHLEAYHDVDIALDTFPYNGTTTTCEALWMGVPVVTQAGEVHMTGAAVTMRLPRRLQFGVPQNNRDETKLRQGLDQSVARRCHRSGRGTFIDGRMKLRLTELYLVALLVLTWGMGRLFGLLMAVLACTSWAYIEATGGAYIDNPRAVFWNWSAALFSFIVMVVALTELRRALEDAHFQSRKDTLTGLVNKGGFYQVVSAEIEVCRRYKRTLSIAYIDCDNFKVVNDKFGHHVGDELLRVISKTMLRKLRSSDLPGRLGGDEFAVMLPETNAEACRMVIEMLQQRLLHEMKAHNWPVTFSIGIATFLRMLPFLPKIAALIVVVARRVHRPRLDLVCQHCTCCRQ